MSTKIVLSTFFAFAIISNTYAQDGRAIAERSSNAIEFESMEMVSTLNIHDNKGNTRVRQVAIATRKFGDVTKTLMRFLSPADVQGTSILVYDYATKSDDMWLYLPSMRKVRRIVSTEKGKSFMGSEFSNADMSRPNIDDFTYKVLGSETIVGKDCWKLEATCSSAAVESENGFSKRVSIIEKETNLMHRSELYDKTGKLLKVMTLSDYRKQPNNRYFAYSMDMENVVSKRRSEMRVNQFQLGSKLDENSFAVSSLEK
jgi:outer membrane lipoprotein-sorting protein